MIGFNKMKSLYDHSPGLLNMGSNTGFCKVWEQIQTVHQAAEAVAMVEQSTNGSISD